MQNATMALVYYSHILTAITIGYMLLGHVFDVYGKKRAADKIFALEQKLLQLQKDHDKLIEEKYMADRIVRWHENVCPQLYKGDRM